MNEQTPTPTPGTRQQGTHHFILTVQKPGPHGLDASTFTNTFDLPPGMTRQDAYVAIRAEHDRQMPHLADGFVVFFALEPNQL